MKLSEALAYRAKIETAASGLDDATAVESKELFPSWVAGMPVSIGYRCRYADKLYKAIQEHTTQADWTPDKTPALWAEVSVDEFPEWKQPVGSEDAYMIGDKVSYNGKHYESTVDNNVWAPDVYGWSEIQ